MSLIHNYNIDIKIMRKIILSIAFLFLSIFVFAQENPNSTVVTARMPKGSVKLGKKELSKFLHENFKKSGVPLDKENTYQLDGIIISFWDLSVNPESKKSLKATQSEMLSVLKLNNDNVINYSKIISVNNIQYLVYEYQKDDEVYIWFRSDFNKDNKNINGTIQCKDQDKDKAHEVLKTFLESVHFKE
jgi:hypothetical protein